MASAPTSRSSLDESLRAELDDLRNRMLLTFIYPLVGVPFAWLFYLSRQGFSFGPVDIAVIQLIPCVCLVLRLRERNYALACWALIASLMAAHALLVLAHPLPIVLASGVLIAIVAQATLGSVAAVLAVAGTWGLATLAWQEGGNSAGALGVLAFYTLVWGACYLATSPLRTSIALALRGWERAHESLEETRARRAELYRALHALEEATYRIERMNSELITARDAAELARTNKAHFAAMVSHELRGPLNLILGFSRLMVLSPERYNTPLPEAYRADIDTLYLNSQHLADLVDDILDLSQIEVAGLPLVKARVDLETDVVQEALATVRALVERKGLYLHAELAGDLPPILGDQVRLRQVMVNLLTNAARFTERGGITVRSGRQEHNLTVSVQDTGYGIAPEEMAQLFEEFHRLQSAQTMGIKGTGLGLAISKYLVEQHGGRIWAESIQGMGTTLCFSVPMLDTAAPVPSIVSTGAARYLVEARETCLVAIPDPGIVRLLARYVRGYRVVGVPDEEQVGTLVRALHPRAIIATPELGERIQALLTRMPFSVPLITCPIPHRVDRSLERGALLYLIKPIPPQAIETTMRQLRGDGVITVMIVDNDPDAVRLIEMMLTALPRPYQILKAYDGLQALEIMQTTIPDVVFMDLLMPGLDGNQTIARMRADERLRDVPVVIVSAQDAVDQETTLGMPITIWSKGAVDIATGLGCLKAILDALPPHYLPAQATLAPSAADPAP